MLIISGFLNNFDVYLSKELILAYFVLEKEESILMNDKKKKAVAITLVPVTAGMSIRVLVEPRRHTDTLTFTSIHLMYLMIHFLCRKLKKTIVSESFFSNLTFIYLFSTGTAATNKLDDGIPVAHFWNLKYRYSKRYLIYKQIH